MSIVSYTCSSYLTHFLPIRQEFVFFTRGGRKGFTSPCWYIVHIRWSSIFVKCVGVFFELSIWWLLHKIVRFLCSENGKCHFGAIKRKTSSCNIVCHAMMHMYAQYGHIVTNYALILALTLVI